jgi:hypothetical protein
MASGYVAWRSRGRLHERGDRRRETLVVQWTGHQPMETRSAMAHWQNGKLFPYG